MKKCFLFLCFCLVSGCGFSPLYVQKEGGAKWYYNNQFNTSISQEMEKVKVETASGRFGQMVRNILLDNLTPKGEPEHPEYRLYISSVNKREYDQALRQDITATRRMVVYRVTYYMAEDGKKLFTNNSIAYTSYDILVNPYSTTIGAQKAEEEASKIIAQDITLRVGAYFHARFSKYEDIKETTERKSTVDPMDEKGVNP